MKKRFFILFAVLLSLLVIAFVFSTSGNISLQPAQHSHILTGENVLVVYKQHDLLSTKTAEYYAEQRGVPHSQLIGVHISGSPNTISEKQFLDIQQAISAKLDSHIKVIVIAWHAPYRVECMSVTSAFALGFDTKYCQQRDSHASFQNCRQTAASPFFDSSKRFLWQQNQYRLAIMLSGENFEEVKQLIDRGLAADKSNPHGTGFFVKTHEKNRSSRWQNFYLFTSLWKQNKNIKFQYIDDSHSSQTVTIRHQNNVMFYFTGLKNVPDINTNHYLPGAIADHLTSFGGQGITHHGQMKSFRWLEAGVTGSYGTVVEPCNYPQKFSNPQILIPNYMAGDTLIEAYWKSVEQPGEGLFIGEPLARPWSPEN